MSKEDIMQISGASGSIPTFAVELEGPVVIILAEAASIREELRDFARRISRAGCHCLPPDMLHRPGTLRLDLSRRDERTTAVIDAARTDPEALLDCLDAHSRVAQEPRGMPNLVARWLEEMGWTPPTP